MKIECRGFFSYEVLENPFGIGRAEHDRVWIPCCCYFFLLRRDLFHFRQKKKIAFNGGHFTKFLSSKNSPRNVRQTTRFRDGEFFRDEKNLGEYGKVFDGFSARNRIIAVIWSEPLMANEFCCARGLITSGKQSPEAPIHVVFLHIFEFLLIYVSRLTFNL